MLSLIITVVAVALSVILAVATVYYGTSSYLRAGAQARATSLINQSAQVLGAAELHFVEQKTWPDDVDDFVAHAYLKAVPVYLEGTGGAVPWSQPMPGVPTFWVLKSTDIDACKALNLKVRGDDGIYAKARPGFLTQCFGSSEPFTTITTRQGMAEAGAGLDVVFQFFDERNPGSGVEVAHDGGGWAHLPTQSRNDPGGVPASTDKGDADGTYLGGNGQVTIPGQGDSGSNEVNVGGVSNNGQSSHQITFTNNGDTPMGVGGAVGTGDAKVIATTCTGTLQPKQSCTVTIGVGPFPGLTDPRNIGGSVVIRTDQGNVEVGVGGMVQPMPVGPVQVGLTTSDSGDTASLLVFPDTQVGQSAYKWVRVQNVGNMITYAGTPLALSAPFSVVQSDCNGNLAYGSFCWARLAFSPMAATFYSGADHKMVLQANGVSVAIGLSGRGIPKPVAGVSVSPGEVDWGQEFALGEYDEVIEVRNNGELPLQLNGAPTIVEGEASFRPQAWNCGARLAVGASCQVTVRFMPDAAKSYSGKLAISYVDLPVAHVSLKGVGTNPLGSSTLSMPVARQNLAYSTSPDLGTAWTLANNLPVNMSMLAVQLDAGSTLPAGLTFNTTSRRVEGTPSSITPAMTFTLNGIYQGKFSKSQTFSIRVDQALDGAHFVAGVPNVTYSGDLRSAVVPGLTDTRVRFGAAVSTGKWYVEVQSSSKMGQFFQVCLDKAIQPICANYAYVDHSYNTGAAINGGIGLTGTTAGKTAKNGHYAALLDMDAKAVKILDADDCSIAVQGTWTAAGSLGTFIVGSRAQHDPNTVTWVIGDSDTPRCMPADYRWLGKP